MHTSPAIFIAFSTISRAPSVVFSNKAIAADFANAPPDPIAATGLSGSITSPVPLTIYISFVSATRSRASRCRNMRSVRHSFANCTTLLQLRFKSRKKSERIGSGAGETGHNLSVVKTPELARTALQHLAPHGDL